MFFPSLQWALDVFNIHFITLENQKLFVASSLVLTSQRYPNSCPLHPFTQHPFQIKPMDANDNNI
jgi:hypothetical protein